MKQKTLFIIYHDLGIGGVQTKIIDIINYAENIQPHMKIVLILRKKVPTDRRGGVSNAHVSINYYSDAWFHGLKFCFPVYVLLTAIKHRPTSILTFSYIPTVCAAIIKLFFGNSIRVVISEDWSQMNELSWELGQRFSFFRKILFSIAYTSADAICCVNKTIAGVLTQKFHLPENKIHLVDNWASHIENHLPSEKRSIDLIFTGRLEKVKNILFLCKVVEKLKRTMPRILLCIVGEGSEKKLLQNYVTNHNLTSSVVILPFTPHVYPYLVRSKIFILSSVSEGLPMSALEAMACGTPVLCRRFPSSEEFIVPGINGFLYRSQKECISHIMNLLHNARMYKRMSCGAYLYAKQNRTVRNIKQYFYHLYG